MNYVVTLAFAALLTACTSGPKAPPTKTQAELRPPTQQEAERVLRQARTLRTEQGCQDAAPGLRVAAAMGRGFEAAQHELGDCLLQIKAPSPTEAALYQEEAIFWLKRAAYAGNARAQRKLATLYAAPNSEHSNVGAALKWALVYEKNGDADLYGYKSFPPTFLPGLKTSSTEDVIADAERFAADFSPVHLGIYAPPPRARERDESGQRGRAPGGQQERRRRR